jgi:hypothetical protein
MAIVRCMSGEVAARSMSAVEALANPGSMAALMRPATASSG